MKIIKMSFASLLLLVVLASCTKEEDLSTEVDYLIFGHFFGECGGENCIEIFKLESDKLYEDSNDKYPGSSDFYEADFSELSSSLFTEADGLIDLFPSELLDEQEVVIGQPDAGDWGGLYIEYKSGDTRKFWLLDLAQENVPEKYRAFISEVVNRIQRINN